MKTLPRFIAGLSLLIVPGTLIQAQTLVGDAHFAPGLTYFGHLYIDSNDVPMMRYQMYEDDPFSGPPDASNVERYDSVSNTWVLVGAPYYIEWGSAEVGFGRAGQVYYAYEDFSTPANKEIRQLVGSSHIAIGGPFTDTWWQTSASIAADYNDTLYYAAVDGLDMKVMKFNGITWNPVGDLSAFHAHASDREQIQLKFDHNNVPYIIFVDYDHGDRASVIKYNGTTWEYVGNPGFGTGAYLYIDVHFDSQNNIYAGSNSGYGLKVHRYVSGSWQQILDIEQDDVSDGEIGFTTNDVLLAAVQYNDFSTAVHHEVLLQYNGSGWDQLDTLPAMMSTPNSLTMAIDSKNQVYMGASYGDVSVYQFDICTSTILDLSATVTPENTGNDGAIDLTVTGAIGSYTIEWNSGATTEDLISLPQGVYTVKVIDSDGNCQVKGITVHSLLPLATITGKIYADTDLDCILDAGEPGLQNELIKITGTTSTYYTVSNPTGDYTIVLPAGTYDVSAEGPYTLAACETSPVNINALAGDTTEVSFGFDVNTDVDVKVQVVPGNITPGFSSSLLVKISNQASPMPLAGELYFVMPDSLIYTGAVPTPDAINGDTLVWNYTGLSPWGFQHFTVNYSCYVEPTLIGTNMDLCAGVSVTSATDINLSNNDLCLEKEITGSFDPNDKSVSPAGLDADGKIEITENEFTYLIRFQNTGNDTAHNVFITDTLSNLLDPLTVEVTAASHNYLLSIVDGNTLKFKFDNIMLPDSNVNEAASHGYVQFKIKTAAAPTVGQVINNTANIYFDFNPAVVTNTTVNTYFDWSGVEETSNINGMQVYPNPFTSGIFIVNKTGNAMVANITDISGQLVQVMMIQPGNNSYDLGNVNKGVYFIQAGGTTLKLVKQ